MHSPLEVVVTRERERTDRTFGQAKALFDVVHRWTNYDVEVDTSVLYPEQAAAKVRDGLARGLGKRNAALAR